MTGRPTVDQQRAKAAWNAIEDAKKLKGDQPKAFGGHAKKLPMRIRAAGLGQALAFVRAKAHPKGETAETKEGMVLLLDVLGSWVLSRVPSPNAGKDDNALIEAILNGNSLFLRCAAAEAIAFLEWLNRFAEAEGLVDVNNNV